jgi:U2 small nuclear ribonucleoprotein B''
MATTTVTKTGSSTMSVDQHVQPNQSLYIQNLPEKLQKPDLKRSLYMLFSTFGPVLDITAVKSSKMRGQAHVLFRDVHAATQAMRACQGFEFYGREMVSRVNTISTRGSAYIDEDSNRKSATRKRRATHFLK